MQSTITLYDRHSKQKEKIMELFRLKGYCYTQELISLGIYQYNARIKELREHGHTIISQKIQGKFGFVHPEKLSEYSVALKETPY